jgi:Flp pilus assembly protein TadG
MTQTEKGKLFNPSIIFGVSKIADCKKSMLSCVHGSVATMFAIGLPGLLTVVGVASDFAVMEMKRTSLQAVADVSALAAAKELSIASSTDTAIINAANNYVAAEIRENNATAVVTPSVDRKAGSVTVAISEAWTPFFMHFIASGVTPINVSATAILAGTTNVCMLALNTSDNKTMHLDTSAKLTANGCGVYSNANHNHAIWVDNNASIKAELTCAVGGVKLKAGSAITPAAITNCPPIADPLASRAKPAVTASCTYTNLVVSSGNMALTPGHYCGGLKVNGTAQVTLAPGTYVISDADLEVSGSASFKGTHVGFYLDGAGARLNLKDTATISLTGAVNADMAGLLFFEDPAAPLGRQHHIASTNVQNLTGTIYFPQGYLLVDPNSAVIASSSAYTAIIANRIEMTAGPELILNANYGSTDVPVPAGIKSSASVVLSN